MRVLVSVDLEGVAGVVDAEDLRSGTMRWQTARRLMVEEANAAIRGALAADPAAEIVVCDAHADGRNLAPELLDPRAVLTSGSPRRLGMLAGIDRAMDAVVLVGHHARAGTPDAVLAHTFNGATIAAVRIDGVELGEIGLSARLAGWHGAAVVFVSGDDAAVAEAEQVVPEAIGVSVKRAEGAFAAESLSPHDARARIEHGVRAALRRATPPVQEQARAPVEVQVQVLRPDMLERALLIPGVQRIGPTALAYPDLPFPSAYRLALLVATYLT